MNRTLLIGVFGILFCIAPAMAQENSAGIFSENVDVVTASSDLQSFASNFDVRFVWRFKTPQPLSRCRGFSGPPIGLRYFDSIDLEKPPGMISFTTVDRVAVQSSLVDPNDGLVEAIAKTSEPAPKTWFRPCW